MTRLISLVLVLTFLLGLPAAVLAEAKTFSMEEGTPIRLSLQEELSTKTSSAGQKLQLSVTEDILAKDEKTILVKKGAPATGYLTTVDESDGGKGGKLSVEITSVKAVDGSRIPLRCVKAKAGKGGAGVGSYIVGGVLLGFVGLGIVALCSKGKHASMPAGTVLTAFVERDSTIADQSSNSTKSVQAEVQTPLQAKSNIGDLKDVAESKTE
jgi:hypothetical protein